MKVQEPKLGLGVDPQYCKLSTYQSKHNSKVLIIEINCSLFIISLLG